MRFVRKMRLASGLESGRSVSEHRKESHRDGNGKNYTRRIVRGGTRNDFEIMPYLAWRRGARGREELWGLWRSDS